MNIGAEIPFRRRRRDKRATGSLIFDRERDERLRQGTDEEEMRIWQNGRFRKA